MKKELNNFKKSALMAVSGVAFIFFVWMFIFGKVKASELISPILNKLPKNESELVKTTEKVLGEAVEKAQKGSIKEMVKKSSDLFENSDVAEPARQLRENVKQKVEESFTTAKQLPAQEIKVIQRQICKEWLGEESFASPSAR